jgi:hypothetical protein
MAMSSRIPIFLLLTAVTAAISFVSVKTVVVSAQARVALTTTQQKTTYVRSGAVRSVKTVLRGIRSDGSIAEEWSVAAPGNNTRSALQRRIIDLSNSEEVSIDGLTESTTSAPIAAQMVNYHRIAPKCAISASSLRGNMLGYEVVRNVVDRKTASRLIRTEEWLAPALDCLVMKKTISFGKAEADLHISNINEIVEIKIGEPSPALFERPTDYTERSPSQQSAEYAKRYPEAFCAACTKNDQDMDALYYRRRAQGK